jgi:uncharacterized protein YbjT (DUF2867 family)
MERRKEEGMKILVTGARGAVGAALTQILAAQGQQVRAAGRRRPVFPEGAGDIEPVLLDFSDPETFAPALAGVDRVFLSYPMGLGDSEPVERFLQNVKAANVRLLVFHSFAGADRNSFPPQYRIEKALEKSGVPWVILRTGFLMEEFLGPWSGELLEKDVLYVPAGRTVHAFVSGRDAALCAAAALLDPGRFRNTQWNLTGPESLSFKDVAERMGRIAGRRFRYKSPGLMGYRNLCAEKKGMAPEVLSLWLTFFMLAKMGAGRKKTDDVQAITGRPPVSLEEFLRLNQRSWNRT